LINDNYLAWLHSYYIIATNVELFFKFGQLLTDLFFRNTLNSQRKTESEKRRRWKNTTNYRNN
jgi:hypothetical protein